VRGERPSHVVGKPFSLVDFNPGDWHKGYACSLPDWRLVVRTANLDRMGSDTFRCPQCGRVLALAGDTYNPDTRTCRACGRGETPPVPEARTDARSASDVAQTEPNVLAEGVGPAQWTQPTQEEVAPPKVS
jgi:hypothetical protein